MAEIAAQGLLLTVVGVWGDNQSERVAEIATGAPRELSSRAEFPTVGITGSVDVYLEIVPNAAALDEGRIARVFVHFLQGDVTRFLMPGSNAMNILMTRVLGGGGSGSWCNDPQGKGCSQILLTQEIFVPESLVPGASSRAAKTG